MASSRKRFCAPDSPQKDTTGWFKPAILQTWPRFFTIRGVEERALQKLSPFFIHRAIFTALGDPEKINNSGMAVS
jgi:hypothetical protein